MFGYLNLKDPTKIGNNEAQEANNVRMDDGFLEFAQFEIDHTIGRRGRDINGNEIILTRQVENSDVAPAPIQFPGMVKRLTGNLSGWVGAPAPQTIAGSPRPSIAAVAGVGGYPPGEYTYLVTIYDPDTGDEGPAQQLTVTLAAGEVAEIRNLPAISDGFRFGGESGLWTGINIWLDKPNSMYQIYRRPIGGSEFLRLTGTDPVLAAGSAYSGVAVVKDETADADLGVPCPTGFESVAGNDYFLTVGSAGPGTFVDKNTGLIHVHQNRLWIRADYPIDNLWTTAIPGIGQEKTTIIYSRPYLFGEIETTNFFSFSSEVVGMFTVDESLVVLCKEDVFVIYGDDPTTFIVKQATSSGIGSVPGFAAARIGNALVFLGSDKTDREKANGVFVMLGGQISRLSFPIDSLFPLSAYSDSTYGAGGQEDRFFVVRTSGDWIVYDTIAQGFLTASDATTFTYRSKEFGRPGAWDNMRRAFVRGQGDFTIELYYDGVLEDTIDFSLGDSPQTEDFTVPGLRSNYFSFRFIGQSNAKIYEFGRLE